LRADLDIPFRYDITYFADFSGSSGFKGAGRRERNGWH
jgi:hypothetical protein